MEIHTERADVLLSTKMKYRAVLFDLDGTLLDTLQDIADSMNSALAYFGFPQHQTDTYRQLISNGMEALVKGSLPPDHRDEMTTSKVYPKLGEEYTKRWANNSHPYPGIPELLDSLEGLGLRKAILSNTPQSFADIMVSKLLYRWHFEFVVGSSPSVPKKPDPTAALNIAKKMDVEPKDFLYLGDSDVDMKTAVAAGMFPVGALWGFRTANQLISAGAKALVPQPSNLLRILKSESA